MAIVFVGLSECPLCEAVLDDANAYMLVPPLASNTKDLLFKLSDAGVHLECLNRFAEKDKLLKHIQLYNEHIQTDLAQLRSDKSVNPEDVLIFGLLTSDEQEPLYRYNFTLVNLKRLHDWPECSEFLVTAEAFLAQGKWASLTAFNLLEYLIKRVRAGC